MSLKIKGKQIEDATILQGNLNLTTPLNNNDAATKEYVDTNKSIEKINSSNKGMVANSTTGLTGIQLACSTPVLDIPLSGSYVSVFVNGVDVQHGIGKAAYFSADSGTTIKANNNISQGDYLYWNCDAAIYQLETTDVIDFMYVVSSTSGGTNTSGNTLSGHIIQNENSEYLTQQSILQIKGAYISNDIDKTVVDIESISYDSTLQIVGGVATIDLSKNRSYGIVQLSSSTEFTIDMTTRKDQRCATIAIYPQGNVVTFNANLINAGIETIDVTKQNDLLIGAIGTVNMYKILRTTTYTDPQLFAPVITMTSFSETQLNVTWNDNANNIDTEIQISADGINWGASISLGANTTNYQIIGLNEGATRYSRVRFIGDGVIYLTSNWSNIENATTQINLSPTVNNVLLTCYPTDWAVDDVITGSYIYSDTENNAEDTSMSGTTYMIKAYSSIELATGDTTNTLGVIIYSGYTEGSPTPTHILDISVIGLYLKLWVKPKAVGGTNLGVWTSSAVSPIIVASSDLTTSVTWTNLSGAIASGGTLTNIGGTVGQGGRSTTLVATNGRLFETLVTDTAVSSYTRLGIDTSTTLNAQTKDIDYNLFWINNTFYVRSPSDSSDLIVSGYTVTNGDKIGMRIETDQLKVYYKRSGVWYNVYTFPSFTAASRYIHCQMAVTTIQTMNDVKII